MPTLGQFHEFLKFLVDVFGALSSLLILFCAYLIYQVRQEQTENRETRNHLLETQERQNEISIQFVQALAKLRTSVDKALEQNRRLRNGRHE